MNRIGMLRRMRELSWAKEEWFVPLAKALEGLSAADAAWKPPGGGNSIWETLNHINFYNEMMLCHMTGQRFTRSVENNTESFAVESTDPAAWAHTLAETHRIGEGLQRALEAMGDEELDRSIRSGTVGESLLSWMAHDAYHTGQIVLIRKQQGSWPATRE
ncbi:MAG: DinB family protein [Bacillota bacterium]